jgi:hypothetical protein
MKNYLVYISLIIVSFLGLTSCKNDLNVLAPGEESVSVYGVLNPNDAVQNIRINKVYITDGDAIAAGQDANQINYGPGELQVTLQRFMSSTSTTPTLTTVGDNTKKTIVLTETVVTTANGNFNTSQRIWQTTDKLYSSGYYKLTITILKTGKEITAQTNVIDSVTSHSSMPFRYHPTLYPTHGNYVTTGSFPTQQGAYINYIIAGPKTQKIIFPEVANAKLYKVTLRFHYIDSLTNGSTNNEYVDFALQTPSTSPSTTSKQLYEVSFATNDFYTTIAAEIAKKPTVSIKNRRAFYLEYIINAGVESLSTFLQVNAPSTTIAQDKPYYTNINGGVGIFSAMSKSTITHDMFTSFIDDIACHPSTYPLLFCSSIGIVAPSSCP